MKDIIDQLRTLNEIDLKLGTVKRDLERLPRELAEKQGPIKTLKAAIDKNKADTLKLKMEADAAELDLKAGEEALKRLANQMNILKTNKEWDTIRRQMDAQRGWNRDSENKELALMEQIEAKNAELAMHASQVEELEKSSAAESASVEKELAELKVRFDELNAERAKLTPNVPDKELAIYNRIAGTRGTAIAYIENVTCSLCYMRLPAQFINLALIGRELTCCPSCGRILAAKPK